ncbi:MAG TPA: hypothetical protein ENK10_06365 [Acidobacteria bacterium]|nr:hypothetical protein [Acidobacteriota bacterium]
MLPGQAPAQGTPAAPALLPAQQHLHPLVAVAPQPSRLDDGGRQSPGQQTSPGALPAALLADLDGTIDAGDDATLRQAASRPAALETEQAKTQIDAPLASLGTFPASRQPLQARRAFQLREGFRLAIDQSREDLPADARAGIDRSLEQDTALLLSRGIEGELGGSPLGQRMARLLEQACARPVIGFEPAIQTAFEPGQGEAFAAGFELCGESLALRGDARGQGFGLPAYGSNPLQSLAVQPCEGHRLLEPAQPANQPGKAGVGVEGPAGDAADGPGQGGDRLPQPGGASGDGRDLSGQGSGEIDRPLESRAQSLRADQFRAQTEACIKRPPAPVEVGEVQQQFSAWAGGQPQTAPVQSPGPGFEPYLARR